MCDHRPFTWPFSAFGSKPLIAAILSKSGVPSDLNALSSAAMSGTLGAAPPPAPPRPRAGGTPARDPGGPAVPDPPRPPASMFASIASTPPSIVALASRVYFFSAFAFAAASRAALYSWSCL